MGENKGNREGGKEKGRGRYVRPHNPLRPVPGTPRAGSVTPYGERKKEKKSKYTYQCNPDRQGGETYHTGLRLGGGENV